MVPSIDLLIEGERSGQMTPAMAWAAFVSIYNFDQAQAGVNLLARGVALAEIDGVYKEVYDDLRDDGTEKL